MNTEIKAAIIAAPLGLFVILAVTWLRAHPPTSDQIEMGMNIGAIVWVFGAVWFIVYSILRYRNNHKETGE